MPSWSASPRACSPARASLTLSADEWRDGGEQLEFANIEAMLALAEFEAEVRSDGEAANALFVRALRIAVMHAPEPEERERHAWACRAQQKLDEIRRAARENANGTALPLPQLRASERPLFVPGETGDFSPLLPEALERYARFCHMVKGVPGEAEFLYQCALSLSPESPSLLRCYASLQWGSLPNPPLQRPASAAKRPRADG